MLLFPSIQVAINNITLYFLCRCIPLTTITGLMQFINFHMHQPNAMNTFEVLTSSILTSNTVSEFTSFKAFPYALTRAYDPSGDSQMNTSAYSLAR